MQSTGSLLFVRKSRMLDNESSGNGKIIGILAPDDSEISKRVQMKRVELA